MIAFETMEIVWTWQLVGALVYLIVASSLIAIGLLLAMIRAGEVSKVSALFFLVPPLAATVAWIVLDEVMPPPAWLGKPNVSRPNVSRFAPDTPRRTDRRAGVSAFLAGEHAVGRAAAGECRT